MAKLFSDLFRVRKGPYLDVGAHYPFRLSKKQLLYERGWRGVKIDTIPGSMGPFRHHRPEDINIECGVS